MVCCVFTGRAAHRVHWTVHNNSPRTIWGDPVRKKINGLRKKASSKLISTSTFGNCRSFQDNEYNEDSYVVDITVDLMVDDVTA